MQRTVVRVLLGMVTLLLVVAAAGFAWLYFWPVRGMRFAELVAYAPHANGTAPARGCAASLPVGSVDELRPGFAALIAAEGDPGDGHYAVHIARAVTCAQGKARMRYAVDEIRTAAHVRRVFSREEQMAMDLNLMYFGNDLQGVVSAARDMFGKAPHELDAAQWALLCGLIRNPAHTSPYAHADRALARRNEVLAKMRADGALSGRALQKARAEPLGVLGSARPGVLVGPPGDP